MRRPFRRSIHNHPRVSSLPSPTRDVVNTRASPQPMRPKECFSGVGKRASTPAKPPRSGCLPPAFQTGTFRIRMSPTGILRQIVFQVLRCEPFHPDCRPMRIGSTAPVLVQRPARAVEASAPLLSKEAKPAASVTVSDRGRVLSTLSPDDDDAAPAESPSNYKPHPQLDEAEKERVQKLSQRDREVRVHEQAHKAAGGRYAGAIHYEFENGPDGKRYAVGGHVNIDVAPVKGDPEATLKKMQVVRRAALAPAEPSSADRQVAARATAQAAQARTELAAKRYETMRKLSG